MEIALQMIEIQPVMTCAMCQGTGQDYSVLHHKLLRCEICSGLGFIAPISCKGCGRPALRTWPPRQSPLVYYCGLEVCLKLLVRMHIPKKSPTIVEAAQRIEKISNEIAKANRRHSPIEEIRERLITCIER